MSSTEWVTIGPRRIVMDDGRYAEVSAFDVSPRPVTVAEFKRFVNETGYVTVAERRGDEDTFSNNYVLREYSVDFREVSPVQYVSYLDADAYCHWRGAVLPTEVQWLAAVLVDDKSYNPREFHAVSMKLRTRKLIDARGREITGTVLDGKVVLRSGPMLARKVGIPPGQYRCLVPLDFCDPGLNFRIVKQ